MTPLTWRGRSLPERSYQAFGRDDVFDVVVDVGYLQVRPVADGYTVDLVLNGFSAPRPIMQLVVSELQVGLDALAAMLPGDTFASLGGEA